MTDLSSLPIEEINEKVNSLIVQLNDVNNDSIGLRAELNMYEQELQSRLADEAYVRSLIPPTKEK